MHQLHSGCYRWMPIRHVLLYTSFLFPVKHPDSLVESTTLTTQNLEDFALFELELKKAREGNCTTIDKYGVKSKYLNMEKTDGTCQWHGFYNLTRSLFGK